MYRSCWSHHKLWAAVRMHRELMRVPVPPVSVPSQSNNRKSPTGRKTLFWGLSTCVRGYSPKTSVGRLGVFFLGCLAFWGFTFCCLSMFPERMADARLFVARLLVSRRHTAGAQLLAAAHSWAVAKDWPILASMPAT